MPRVAWTLTDDSTGSSVVYSFEVNPKSFSLPGRQATLGEEKTTAPNGAVVVFQGTDAIPRGSFAGSIRTETQHDDLTTWANKWYPLTLADDKGSTWTILISSFKIDRVKVASNAWRHDYTIEFMSL